MQENNLLFLQTKQLLVVIEQQLNKPFLAPRPLPAWLLPGAAGHLLCRLRLCVLCDALPPADCPWFSAARLVCHLKHIIAMEPSKA